MVYLIKATAKCNHIEALYTITGTVREKNNPEMTFERILLTTKIYIYIC